MPRTYRAYEYDEGMTPYVGRTKQMKDYLDKKFAGVDVDTDKIDATIRVSVHESMDGINCQFCGVHNHIERAKNEIINNCDGDGGGCPCNCNLATKDDIQQAVSAINTHTDYRFDEIDFPTQFADINELVRQSNRGCCNNNH